MLDLTKDRPGSDLRRPPGLYGWRNSLRMGQALRTDLLQALCAQSPVLLVLEDLHLGDSRTVKLVDAALSALGEDDEFGPTVRGIGAAVEVAERHELVHEFRRRCEAELSTGGEVGEADVAGGDVAEDLHVRFADVAVAEIGPRGSELDPELVQQSDEQLSDRLAVLRWNP